MKEANNSLYCSIATPMGLKIGDVDEQKRNRMVRLHWIALGQKRGLTITITAELFIWSGEHASDNFSICTVFKDISFNESTRDLSIRYLFLFYYFY